MNILNATKELIEKWKCRHKWDVIDEIVYNTAWNSAEHYKEKLLVCKNCGDIRKIRLGGTRI